MVILGFHVEEEGEKVHMMGAPDSSNGHACCLKLRHLIYRDGVALSKRLMQFYVTLATTVLLEVWALSLDERRHLRYVCSGGSDLRRRSRRTSTRTVSQLFFVRRKES